jgi:hypothetical protein
MRNKMMQKKNDAKEERMQKKMLQKKTLGLRSNNRARRPSLKNDIQAAGALRLLLGMNET